MIPVVEKTNKISVLKSNISSQINQLTELLTCYDHVFVIADWFKELLEYNGFNSSKISYIPPITAYDQFTVNNSKLKRKLVFAGRIESQKGLHLLCKALNRITTKAVELDVFGNMEDEEYFKKCEKEFSFNFKGPIPRNQLLSKLNDYDFLVLPSVFTEMYPLVIEEAIQAHLPVIASAAKGNVAVIREGKNGFIFDYDDYIDLALVIEKAYSLKKNGWQPVFETTGSYENDLKEILSYYS